VPRIALAKYEGIGNDFVVIDAAGTDARLDADAVRRICDRHYGVGADGVITLSTGPGPIRMTIHNADGSVARTCGNGVRCAALHLSRNGRVGSEPFTIELLSGSHRCRVLEGGQSGRVEVAMRPASFEPKEVPVRAEAPLLDATLAVGGASLAVTALSVGNPHAVTFDDVGERRLVLGPALGADPRFPEGVNVGFARIDGPRRIVLHVWERGAGWTLACGSGACAGAAAAVRTGRLRGDGPVEVVLPGGSLQIDVGAPGSPLVMTGPARHVFDAVIEN
jgi:diaminopimelate epimerase